jgi:hypothetical protein
MSHVVAISLQVKDLKVVKQMCADNGWTFKEGQTTYKWYGRHVGDYPMPKGMKKEDLGKCDHAIGVPKTDWEIGLVKDKKGEGYRLAYDFFGSQGAPLKAAVGPNGNTFRQSYAAAKATMECKARGYQVSRSTTEAGAVRLTVTGRFA